MTIRNRLTLLFTGLFAALLLGFAFYIYFSSSQTREEEYYKRLSQQAITKANLLLDAKVAPDVLQLIYKNAPHSLFQEEVAIYDTAFHLLYHDAVEIDKIKETPAMIHEIIQKGEIRFTQGNIQAVGILYRHKGQSFVITAAATDEYGLIKLSNLKYTLLIGILCCILLTILAGRLFSREALKPVSKMVDEVEEITETSLDLRVKVENGKDEIGELAITFNRMLDRLEHSFAAQRQFVSNVSHELRTPLAAIVTELELALQKDRTTAEYKNLIALSLKDARRLVKLSNGLLDLAKANYDPSAISIREIRLDELLMDAREMVLKSNDVYKVTILFEQEIEDGDYISVNGNEYLLKVAFVNLMENGCKFSADHQCTVAITYFEDKTILRFTDTGIGISEQDQCHIFTPFFRGSNQEFADGNGIGLSLTKKIIQLHKGSIQVISCAGEGTIFTIELPHV